MRVNDAERPETTKGSRNIMSCIYTVSMNSVAHNPEIFRAPRLKSFILLQILLLSSDNEACSGLMRLMLTCCQEKASFDHDELENERFLG